LAVLIASQSIYLYIYPSSTKSRRPGKTICKKNVLETCVNGAMQDPSLGIDAGLHQFINKLCISVFIVIVCQIWVNLRHVKIETGGLVSSQWKKYIKYSVYHITELANEIVNYASV
jgi:hypothetical protein